MDTAAIISLEQDNILQTYDRFPVAIEKGEGAILFDADGKKYIDMTSGIGVSSLGYNNAKIKQAMTEQMNKVFHTSNLFYNSTSIKLAAKLTELTGMSKVFLCNSGAEANEGAIKIARKYGNDNYAGNRNTIITLKDSFHGRTITTLAATGQEKYHNYFFPFTNGFKHVEMNNIDELVSAIDDSVCAIMLEAVQGEGGIHPVAEEYVKAVAKLCKEKDLVLVFDEIQCGVGRTGKLYAYEAYGVKPDIVTSAKGLAAGMPIGAILCGEKVDKVLKKGDHGSTFGGNLMSAAVAIEVLNNIGNAEFLKEVEKKGNFIFESVKALGSDKVVEIRGRGLMVGVELNCEAKGVIGACIEKGVLFLSAGKNVIRMLPPLVISYEELKTAINTLGEVLAQV